MMADHLAANPDAVQPAISAQRQGAAGPLAGIGVVAALSVIAGSSCCVLPLVLAGIGAGSAAFGGLEFLAGYRPYLLGAAVLLTVGAWGAFWRRSRAAACTAGSVCARPATSRRTMILLGVATACLGLAAAWGLIEPVLLRAIQ